MEISRISVLFNQLIKEHDLPKVVFHSLRHSSITYKLKLNGGDVKAVQGDSNIKKSGVYEVEVKLFREVRGVFKLFVVSRKMVLVFMV